MTTIRVGPGLDDNRPTLTIGFPRVFQTFFIHFHSQNNSISSLKMSFTTSRFQFQTCVKQFQYFVIIFQTSFIDFRCLSCLIRPILRCVMNRRSKFVLFIFKLFFISIRQVLTRVLVGSMLSYGNIQKGLIKENVFVRWHGKIRRSWAYTRSKLIWLFVLCNYVDVWKIYRFSQLA